MRVTYTGHDDLTSKQRDKLEGKLSKLSKMLDPKGDKEARVILSEQRHLRKVEITVNAHDHALVGAGANADLFTAICEALEKIEKQALKMRTKWWDTHRHNVPNVADGAPAEAIEAPVKSKGGKQSRTPAAVKTKPVVSKTEGAKNGARVYRVNPEDGRKPMTV